MGGEGAWQADEAAFKAKAAYPKAQRPGTTQHMGTTQDECRGQSKKGMQRGG